MATGPVYYDPHLLRDETVGPPTDWQSMSLIRIALIGLSLLVAAPCMAQGVPGDATATGTTHTKDLCLKPSGEEEPCESRKPTLSPIPATQGEIPTCEGLACLDWGQIILEWMRTPEAFANLANLGSIDIQRDLGGRLDIFVEMSQLVAKAGTQVSILGPCVSACTMAVAFIQQDHLCFGRDGSLGFHMARDKDTNVPNLQWSQWMIDRYPIKIRQWIEAQGGVKQMSVEKIWYLYAPDLWKMGYRRCAAANARGDLGKNSRPP